MGRRLNPFARTRIVNMKRSNISNSEIRRRLLQEDNIKCSRQAIANFWKSYCTTGLLTSAYGGGRKPELANEHLEFIDTQLTQNNELTCDELKDKLKQEFDITVSRFTVLRARRKQGWRYGATRYCQLVSDKNKVARVQFCQNLIDNPDAFDNVIFTDETMVQEECHVKRQCHKLGEPLHKHLRPKPKHPYSIMAWAGISKNGATPIICFQGKLNSLGYQQLLDTAFLPWLREKNMEHDHRFWQDNAPVHQSRSTTEYLATNNINWHRTPAQSPVSFFYIIIRARFNRPLSSII